MLADSHPIIGEFKKQLRRRLRKRHETIRFNDRSKFSLFILIGSFLRQLNRTFNIGLTFFPWLRSRAFDARGFP